MVGANIERMTSKSSGLDEDQEPELTTKAQRHKEDSEPGRTRMSCHAVCGVDNERMNPERNRRALMLLLAAVAVIPCRKPDYFPLRENQQWRYAATESEVVESDTSEAGNLTYAIAVVGSAVEPGLGKVSQVRIRRDGEPYLSFSFRKTATAVFVLPTSRLDGLEPTSGWVKLLGLPLREGAFWYGDQEQSLSVEVVALETVETPAGSFRDCFRIRIHAPVPFLIDLWFAPDVGIIRWHRRFSASRFEVAEQIPR